MSRKQVQINALVQSGNEFRERGELDKAIAQYSQALNLRPNCFKALNQLASLYESRQEFHKAIAYYEQVVQLEPENSRALGRLARSI